MIIVGTGKMFDGFCFSDLPCPFDNQGQMVGGVFPVHQEIIHFTGQTIHKNIKKMRKIITEFSG